MAVCDPSSGARLTIRWEGAGKVSGIGKSGVERQAHRERCPLAGDAVDGNDAAMGADQSVDDAETKTGATGGRTTSSRVAAPEALEDAGLVLGWDPGALVGDGHFDPAAIAMHADPSRGPSWGVSAHIGEQVVDRLAQANRIAHHYGRPIEITRQGMAGI